MNIKPLLRLVCQRFFGEARGMLLHNRLYL